MSACDYRYSYHDFIKDKIKVFRCNEIALDSNKCKFHDDDYAYDHKIEVTELITKKIEDAVEFELPILCVGYKIPKLELENIKFTSPVSFANSEFFDNAIFDNCQFLEEVDFSDVYFHQDASFLNVTFHKYMNFSNAIIDNEASFQNSFFMNNALFQYTKIQKSSFLNSTFHDVDFTDTIFHKFVSFVSVIFNGKTIFRNTSFKEESDFSYSRFLSSTYFIETNFFKQADLRNIIFEKPHETYFDSNLSWVSLIETDVTKVKFGNKTEWSNRTIDSKDYKIYDEWKIEQGIDPELSLENVMDVYRNLRENFDFYLRYETSGEFFVREMELKRKYKEKKELGTNKIIPKNIFEQIISPLGVYNIISKYGHSLSRPVYVSIPLLSLFSALFCFESASDPAYVDSSLQDLLLMSIFRSTTNFFPFYSFADSGYLDIILRIILLPISATFFIGLKRKLERKFRH